MDHNMVVVLALDLALPLIVNVELVVAAFLDLVYFVSVTVTFVTVGRWFWL